MICGNSWQGFTFPVSKGILSTHDLYLAAAGKQKTQKSFPGWSGFLTHLHHREGAGRLV